MVAVALNHSYAGLLALMTIAGALMTMTQTSVNSILQERVTDGIRGQTTSLYMIAMRGGLSLGSLATGVSVNYFGVRTALLANGLLALAAHAVLSRAWASDGPGTADAVSAKR